VTLEEDQEIKVVNILRHNIKTEFKTKILDETEFLEIIETSAPKRVTKVRKPVNCHYIQGLKIEPFK
jgi:hypothetical protein